MWHEKVNQPVYQHDHLHYYLIERFMLVGLTFLVHICSYSLNSDDDHHQHFSYLACSLLTIAQKITLTLLEQTSGQVGWLQHAAAAVAVNVETSAKVNGFFFLFLSLLWFFGYDHPLKKQQLLVFWVFVLLKPLLPKKTI